MAHGEVNVQPPQNGTNTPAAERTYAVHRVDLPTYCPVPGSSLWNGHPRVYIPLKETGDQARSAASTAPEMATTRAAVR